MTTLAQRLAESRKNCGFTQAQVSNSSYGSRIVEYAYINYKITDAELDLKEVTDTLSAAQIALDTVNNQVEFEIDI